MSIIKKKKKKKEVRSSNCRQLGEARSNVVLRRWQWLAMLVVGLGSQQRYTEEKSEEQTSHDRGIMGARRRRSIVATLAFLMLMGIALYFRLWAIHYNLSSDDTQLLRSPLSSENNILLFCAMLVLLIDTAKRNTIVLWRFFFYLYFGIRLFAGYSLILPTERQWMSLQSGGWGMMRR